MPPFLWGKQKHWGARGQAKTLGNLIFWGQAKNLGKTFWGATSNLAGGSKNIGKLDFLGANQKPGKTVFFIGASQKPGALRSLAYLR